MTCGVNCRILQFLIAEFPIAEFLFGISVHTYDLQCEMEFLCTPMTFDFDSQAGVFMFLGLPFVVGQWQTALAHIAAKIR